MPQNQFVGEELIDITISPVIVEMKSKALRPTGSPGPDRMHARILHEAARTMAVPLARLFQRSLDASILPDFPFSQTTGRKGLWSQSSRKAQNKILAIIDQ